MTSQTDTRRPTRPHSLFNGYALPFQSRKTNPKYLPVMNQVWINDTFSESEEQLILSHEYAHIYTTSVHPPRLLPLNSALKGNDKRNWVENFKDIIETVCEAYFWTQMLQPERTDIGRRWRTTQYQDVYRLFIRLIRKMLRYIDPTIFPADGISATVNGLSVLLMHMIPLHPSSGSAIIQELMELDPPPNWTSKQELFWALYAQIDKKREHDETIKKTFALAMPVGYHRCIADTVYFMGLVFDAVNTQPDIVTAAFPTLLQLLTQSSFVLIPVIIREKCSKQVCFRIKVIHTTSRTIRIPDRMLIRQSSIPTTSERKNNCSAIEIFSGLVQASREFRLSNSTDRSWRCFAHLIRLLPRLLSDHPPEKCRCSGCRCLLREPAFRNAHNKISTVTEPHLRNLVKAAERYPEWMEDDLAELIQKEWKLDSPPKFRQAYRFL